MSEDQKQASDPDKNLPDDHQATKPSSDASSETLGRKLKNKIVIAVLCAAFSALAVVPFFFMGWSEDNHNVWRLRMPTTHDMFLHYDQMRSFHAGLSAGEVYPRWEEDTNRGFGAPTTSYYPPGIYYLTSACFWLTRDWVRALLLAHLLMMIAAAAAIYLYARQVMGRVAAVITMTAYSFLPYHLADQYHREAIAELLGFIWIPLILLFADRLLNVPSEMDLPDTRRSLTFSIIGLALSYGAFLWSHPPTAYQFTLAFGVYVLVMCFIGRRWLGLGLVAAAVAIGLGLAGAYLLPAAMEQNLIHKEFITQTWPYHNTYIFVHELYTANTYSGFFLLLNWIWITGTAVIVIAAGLFLSSKRTPGNPLSGLKQRVVALTIVGILASFMMTRISMPIGKLIPKIDIGVFTWRMLSITTLVVAFLLGVLIQARNDKTASLRKRRIMSVVAIAVLAGFVMFTAVAVMRPAASFPEFIPEDEHINYATLPSAAPVEVDELPDDVPEAELAEDNGQVTVLEWKPEHRVIRAELTDRDDLWIRTFNFPGWTATVDGQITPIQTDEELGDMSIGLGTGVHQIELDFRNTPVRRSGVIITRVSSLLVVLLFLIGISLRLSGHRRAFS